MARHPIATAQPLIMIELIVVPVFLILWLIIELATAPRGRQDNDGFHYDL